MSDDNEIVDVIFKWEGKGDYRPPLAVFPGLVGTRDPHTCAVYAHAGQHASADVGYAASLRRADLDHPDVAALRRELEGAPFNYRFHAVRRFTRKHLAQRRAQVRE